MEEYKEYYKQVMLYFAERCNKALGKKAIQLEFNVIKSELSFKEFKTAVNKLIKDYKYNTIPRPADFIEQVKDNRSQAIMACDKVLKAIREYGHLVSPVFDDPIIHLVIDRSFGGWAKITGILSKDVKYFKKDFIKSYQAYKNKKMKIPKLRGLYADDTVYIGKKDIAQKVELMIQEQESLSKKKLKALGGIK